MRDEKIKTVGDLLAALKDLPKELPIEIFYCDDCRAAYKDGINEVRVTPGSPGTVILDCY